jgi:hypothetical protein
MEGYPPDDDDPLVPPPESDEGEGGDAGRVSLADGVKKALLAGMGALFMTEEGARRLARDWKLPKDVASFLGQQATSAKDEVLRIFGDEIRRFLESESVRKEFLKALSEHTIEIRAEIRLKPEGEGPPRPEVKAEVRPRRGGKKGR